jgi:hypothetical protein
MNDDPIVAEVRRVREGRSRLFNYDIHAIFADLMARERAEDPAHPLVNDARQCAQISAQQNSLVLRDQPELKG